MNPKASYYHPRAHVCQKVVHGNLVTVFRQDDALQIPAGVLICRPWTEEDSLSYEDDTDILGMTVTRDSILFHDAGTFINTTKQ